MKILEDKITEILEDLDKVEVGSEEYERISNSIAVLAKANADDKKAENEAEKVKTEEKSAKVQKWASIITAFAAVGTVVVGVLREILKYLTNLRLMKYEEEDVMTSKAFDNR